MSYYCTRHTSNQNIQWANAIVINKLRITDTDSAQLFNQRHFVKVNEHLLSSIK